MSQKPERLATVYKQNSHFKRLAARARQLDKLNTILQENLPLQFANHCHLANISGDRLIVHTDKAAFASLLRFQAPQLCKTLSEHLPEPVTRLEVKVRPLDSIQRPVHAGAYLHLSTKTAALLQSTAAEIEDGPLKAALKKLASRKTD